MGNKIIGIEIQKVQEQLHLLLPLKMEKSLLVKLQNVKL